MGSLLEVQNISKYFGKLKAVDRVSFTLADDEILGVAGPNGAGKTTLFNTISGLPYHADSGRIVFLDQFVEKSPGHRICHLGIARTFQKETVFDTLNIYQNVTIGAYYGRPGQNKKSTHDRTMAALELVGLSDEIDQPADRLNLFDRKNLMLASALAGEPKLLLLDEPASGLNQPEMNLLAELYFKINAQGVAIIIIEHKLPLLLKISNRVMILNEGRKLAEGPPNQVIRDPRVIEAYLGRRSG